MYNVFMVGDFMLGKIIAIEENIIELDLNVKISEIENIINYYVIIEDTNKKIIGEIVDIKGNSAFINLLGEFNDDNFVF